MTDDYDSPDLITTPDHEWIAELHRRCAEYDADPSTGVTWEEVKKKLAED